MQKSYTDYMRKRFRDNNEKATILEVGEFADWIHGEVASSIRATEAADVWRQSCLVPLDENRLRNCLQGNPATAAPEDRSPVFDGRFDSDSNAQRMFSTWSPPRTSVPLPIIPSTEASSRHSSPESDDDEFDSGNETVTNHHPITPCRTPRLPKTARAKTAEKGPSDSVMSSKKRRDILNRCIDGSPKTQKRYRGDLILDRGDLEKENARLKERVELWNSLRSRDGDSTEMLPFPMWQLKPLFFFFFFFFLTMCFKHCDQFCLLFLFCIK